MSETGPGTRPEGSEGRSASPTGSQGPSDDERPTDRLTVGELIAWLSTFPAGAAIQVYEGEVEAITVILPEDPYTVSIVVRR